MDVNAWFSKRTLGHRDYATIARLVELKKKQKLSVSVCLPTLNSAASLGLILRVIKELLVDEYKLVDELAIVDGGSTDDTVDIARKYDALVFYDNGGTDNAGFDSLPAASGKGEGLWKSVYHLSGDIIAWLDSDIRNIHPRFVYGTVGPLLSDPTIGYVKGFYERPITEGGVVKPSGGGRVTELVARPLLNLYYPELSGLIQPLSGEYAGRREVLESVPFVSGYGVETGLLIDILDKFGVDAIAQVNLDTRIHANQTLESLGRMSFGVMQTVLNRLDRDKKIKMLADYGTVLNAIKHEGADYSVEPRETAIAERPPMITMPEYQKKFKKRKAKWPSA